MKEDGVARYVEPSMCTSREQEVALQKREKFLTLDSQGKLSHVTKATDLKPDLSGEFCARMALQRRRVAQFPVHVDRNLILRPQPTDYHQGVSLEQVLNADHEMWTLVSQQCRSGVKVLPDGTYPVEVAIRNARLDPFLMSTLQPLPILVLLQSVPQILQSGPLAKQLKQGSAMSSD
eukprot:2884553-Amphidinium_carterae.1